MKILATGGAGYVGSATVRSLLARGHEVAVYDNLSTGYCQAVPAETLVQGDVGDREKLAEVMRERQIEVVIHFAGFIAVGESTQKPREYYRNNVVNSLILLEAMQQAQVAKILFSSTAAVYAPVEQGALAEDDSKQPESPYAFSKFATERLISDFAAAYGLGYTILRYFNACGASADGTHGENHKPETHLIPLALQVPLGRREKIGVFGRDYDTPDGTCIRDYVHVDDLADAHIRAAEAIELGRGSVYNIGTGTGHSVLEVIREAQHVVGKPIATEYLDRRAGDTTRLVAGAQRLRNELGWQPQYTSLRDIIATAWQWHETHPNGYE